MKVLIVDDNYNIAETIADYLSLTDITVDFAYNGLAAIKLLESERFDVIIMDIMMPKFDGIATVTKLRDELRCDTPILFLTAKDSLADKVAFSTSSLNVKEMAAEFLRLVQKNA